jgi:hypothetical protein
MKKLIAPISFIIYILLVCNFAYAANVRPLAAFGIPFAGSSLPEETVRCHIFLIVLAGAVTDNS